jgi:hypothetical protein
MKMRSPQMIGVDAPLPGSFTFHLMFLSSAHSVGGSASGAAPVPSGPRHCGQFWAACTSAACAVGAAAKTAMNNVRP